MSGYVKVFTSILQSTIWQEHATVRVLWITMLALADRDGIVEGSVPGLARTAGITINECEEALATLNKPDPYSRTRAFDGRRIAEVDGGWEILNFRHYREKLSREYNRERDAMRKRRQRERERESDPGVTPPDAAEKSPHTSPSPSPSPSDMEGRKEGISDSASVAERNAPGTSTPDADTVDRMVGCLQRLMVLNLNHAARRDLAATLVDESWSVGDVHALAAYLGGGQDIASAAKRLAGILGDPQRRKDASDEICRLESRQE